MLDVMRSNARSSLIVVIFGAIIVTFIFSFGRGSSGFRTRTPETWAAKVNGELVTAAEFAQAYGDTFRYQASARGGKYTVDDAKRDDLRRQTLSSLVDRALLAQQAQKMGIRVPDEEVADFIARSPAFQQNGKFDFESYKNWVENGRGMSIPRFEEGIRRELLVNKARQAMANAATVSDDEVKAFYVAEHESASITYVKFSSFMFQGEAQVPDAEVDAYLKSHQKEVEEAYARDQKTRFTQPPATKVRAITIPVPPGSTPEQEQAARQRIDAALAEVKSGKDFAAVAKEKSEDPSTKGQGGELGFVSRGGSPYGKTLEEEAEKLKVGEVSPVFKDRGGFHILKAEEKRAESVKPLADVQKQIAQDQLRAQKASELAKKKAEAALAAVRSGKSLTELYPAKKTEPGQFDFSSLMTPQAQDTEAFHPYGGYIPNVGVAPKLSAAVFALGGVGDVPPAPIEENDAWYVFRVKTRERADVSKLDDAERKTLRQRLEQRKANELYQSWIDRVRKQSDIVENTALLAYDQTGHEQFNPDD
jgi:peptidyl-prolyl cis-trans isomerase D